jgi:hypothetical protein
MDLNNLLHVACNYHYLGWVLTWNRDWEEFFVKEIMALYLTTSRGHFRE